MTWWFNEYGQQANWNEGGKANIGVSGLGSRVDEQMVFLSKEKERTDSEEFWGCCPKGVSGNPSRDEQ